MSNVCNTCSNLVDLTTLICGSSTCSYNYRFNLWFDETNKAGFLIYNSLIPDIFRKCFSKEVINNIKDCKNICPYYEKQKSTNLYLGYQKRTMNLLSQNDIKSLLFFGYSTPSFKYIKSIDNNKVELTNNEILLFNQILESNNRNVLNGKSATNYISNHQVTFFNYFTILYPPNTLIYQFINLIMKAKKTYDYVLLGKKYLCKVNIYWEYTLNCNSELKNNTKETEITENYLAYLYVLYEQYLANKLVTYQYYKKFFDIIRYALDVYNDIYLVYKKQSNYLKMPLFNKMNTFNICKRPYMLEEYQTKSRRYYNNYITNKSKIYANKLLNINVDKEFNFESILANIIPIKVIFPNNTFDKNNFFKENYPLLEFNFDDDSFPKIEKYYFLNRMDNLNIDLSKFKNIICWNYFNDIILDILLLLWSLP